MCCRTGATQNQVPFNAAQVYKELIGPSTVRIDSGWSGPGFLEGEADEFPAPLQPIPVVKFVGHTVLRVVASRFALLRNGLDCNASRAMTEPTGGATALAPGCNPWRLAVLPPASWVQPSPEDPVARG